MTTAQNLIDRAQNKLDDAAAATWSEAELLEWLNDAIRDYTTHFKRERKTNLTTSANDRTYDLPSDFSAILTVEYPAGQDIPDYLGRLGYWHSDFYGNAYYDVQDGDTAVLIIGEEPAAGETITVRYLADHDYALAAGGTVTVPALHHDLLITYIRWQAVLQLLAAEQANPTADSALIMSQLSASAAKLHDDYNDALGRAIYSQPSHSQIIRWSSTDGQERIY